jgi:hypothetical protein
MSKVIFMVVIMLCFFSVYFEKISADRTRDIQSDTRMISKSITDIITHKLKKIEVALGTDTNPRDGVYLICDGEAIVDIETTWTNSVRNITYTCGSGSFTTISSFVSGK